MVNFKSFLQIFKKKNNESQPENRSKTSRSITKPKQIISSGLKSKQNSGLQTQKSDEKSPKILETSKSQSVRKRTLEEKGRRIELVGNYLKKDEKPEEPIPIRPQRKSSKHLMKVDKSTNTLKEKESKSRLQTKSAQNRVNTNEMSLSFDSITEMTSNRVLKTEEKHVKSGNHLKPNDQKNEDQIKGLRNESYSSHSLTSKSINDLIVSEFNFLNGSQTSLKRKTPENDRKPKVVSGIVPIQDIDLKTAKCMICWRLCSTNINITVCSHLFCAECMRQWIRFSQHCPQCRTFISSFGHSVRTQFDRICIRSENDYKVMRVSEDSDNFVDSLGAAYNFNAFLLNRKVSKYFDSNIANICAKISDLESKLSTVGSVQMSVNIRHTINEQNYKLEEFKQKKRQSEESLKEIYNETDPQMMSFWKQVLALREN